MFKKNDVVNAPEYAMDYPVWVVSKDDDGDLWFWGAYKTMEKAVEVAEDIGGYTCV